MMNTFITGCQFINFAKYLPNEIIENIYGFIFNENLFLLIVCMENYDNFCLLLCIDRRHSSLKKIPLMLKKQSLSLNCANAFDQISMLQWHLPFAISNIAMPQFVAICCTHSLAQTINRLIIHSWILFKGKHTLLFHSYSNLYLFPSNQERNNNIIVIFMYVMKCKMKKQRKKISLSNKNQSKIHHFRQLFSFCFFSYSCISFSFYLLHT